MKLLRVTKLFQSPFGRSLATTLLVLTLAPMLALIVFGSYTVRTQLQERSTAQIANVAGMVQQSIADWVKAANDQLVSTVQNPSTEQSITALLRGDTMQQMTDGLAKDLTALQKSGNFSSLYLVQPDGTVMLSTDAKAVGSKLGVEIEPMQQAGKQFWGFDKLPLTGQVMALSWQPILPAGKDPETKSLGFLVGALNIDGMAGILREHGVGIGTTGKAYLLDPNYIPLTSVENTSQSMNMGGASSQSMPKPAENSQPMPMDPGSGQAMNTNSGGMSGMDMGTTGSTQPAAPDQPTTSAYTIPMAFDPQVAAALQSGRFSGAFNSYSGAPSLGAIERLQAPLSAWLVVEQEQAEAFAVLNTLAQTVIVFALILSCLVLMASFGITRRIIKPLRSLDKAAQVVARGDLKTRVSIPRKDEFGSLATSFNAMAADLDRLFNDLQGTNNQLKHRAEQLDTITRVGQHATSLLRLDTLLNNIVQEIQKAFGYYAVVLYLPKDKADLNPIMVARAAAGAAADEIVSSGTVWATGEGLVGNAAQYHSMVAVQDVHGTSVFRRHKLHPETRSEASIPLLIDSGNQLIGVLDIQSDKARSFSTDDLEVLQILGNQIAISIRNADLFQESEAARRAADDANRHKSEFLSNMSHELRTPLNVIIGYSHSILNRPAMYNNEALPVIYGPAIQSIMTSGQHLLGLINDILDLSKIEAGQIDLDIKATDPLPILQGVRATALGLVKKGVDVRVDYVNGLPYVLGDELRIRQVLLNLVANAAKFTEQGTITLGAKLEPDHILFTVADTGPGIPQDAQDSLFNRFTQANSEVTRKYGGTGLGLHISRQLVELQGGQIWFKSKTGKGTSFFFTIPLLTVEEVKKRTGSMPAVTPENSDNIVAITPRASMFTAAEGEAQTLTRQVILVDTRMETRNALYTALAEAGFDVLTVEDHEQAHELASAILPDGIIVHFHTQETLPVANLVLQLREDPVLAATPIIDLMDAAEGKDSENWCKTAIEQIQNAMLQKAA